MEGRAAAQTLLTGQDIHPADGGNGRQSFTAEAQRADLAQIVGRAHLGRGVAQERGGQFFGRDAAAVVRHTDETHAAPLDLHHDGGGTRIDGVLHQLFHNAGGALHHFAGGNQIRHMGC